MGKIYVLDTSVLIHDPESIRKFEDNVVAVPIFVVMELDLLKEHRRYEVASAARMVSRYISELMDHGDVHSPEGVRHPEHGTLFRVIANGGGQGLGAMEEAESSNKMDRLIISSAISLRDSNPDHEVVLVSKDVNMRIVAKYEGLASDDYRTDRVDPGNHYKGFRKVDLPEDVDVQRAYRGEPIPASELGIDDLVENEFVKVPASEGRHHLFRNYDGHLEAVPKDFNVSGVVPLNSEQRMAMDLVLYSDTHLITLIGKAGTGKTFLALSCAIHMLSESWRGIDKVVLAKPVISMGKDIGFLPGDFESKMEPWMMSFFDNLDQLMPSKSQRDGSQNWRYLFDTGKFEIQAVHSIRGRSISKSVLIIDEAQNLSPHEIKTIITRAAKGTKVILMGDPHQIDCPFMDRNSNGLVYVTDRMKGEPIFGTVTLTKGERSQLAETASNRL